MHGDAKPGNFAFVDGEVSAVFDWELTDVGDPLADIGYLELMWAYPVGITSRPTAPAIDDVLARYEERSGITLEHRPWYRALQAYKTAVILLVGSMLFEAGHTDDMRNLEMALGIDMTTQPGLRGPRGRRAARRGTGAARATRASPKPRPAVDDAGH